MLLFYKFQVRLHCNTGYEEAYSKTGSRSFSCHLYPNVRACNIVFRMNHVIRTALSSIPYKKDDASQSVVAVTYALPTLSSLNSSRHHKLWKISQTCAEIYDEKFAIPAWSN